MSMPITTLTSSSNTSISHTNSPPEIRRKPRDVSFSSYLEGGDEETFVLQLRGTNNPRGIFGKNKTQDREIDVFDAEKYFREGPKYIPRAAAAAATTTTNNSSIHRQIKKDEAFQMVATKEPSRVATPSICSESSWNSRGALLHTVARNQQPSKRTNYKKSSFLTNIRCNYCSCGDKNSVDIDDKTEETGSKQNIGSVLVNGKSKQGDNNCVKLQDPGLRVNSNGHFTFPVLNQGTKLQAQEVANISTRKSLEVFGSPVMMEKNSKNCLRVEKKLSMVTWDAIDDQQIITKFNPISKEVDNDSDSDASSDLFEIESLSKGDPFLSRTASEGMSGSVSTTNCYAPSEASVEWSVITASAADFSVLSDSEELRSSERKMGQKILAGRDLPSKRYSGILPGCKNQKAVRVAEDVYRGINSDNKEYSNSRAQIRSESLITSMARFKDHENRLAGLFRQQSFDARVLSQPRSANGVDFLHSK